MADDVDALVARLGEAPNDEALRESAARALADAGRAADSVALLTSSLKNLTAHTRDKVPCLCRRCLEPGREVLLLSGIEMRRDFIVAAGRVLFFWRPVALRTDPAALRDQMREGLARRLTRAKGRKAPEDEDEDEDEA